MELRCQKQGVDHYRRRRNGRLLLERINARYGTELQWGIAENALAGSKLTDIYYSGAESYLQELLGEGHPLLGKKLHCASRYGGWDNRPEQGIVMEWAYGKPCEA